MTVQELIDKLEKFPKDLPVYAYDKFEENGLLIEGCAKSPESTKVRIIY